MRLESCKLIGLFDDHCSHAVSAVSTMPIACLSSSLLCVLDVFRRLWSVACHSWIHIFVQRRPCLSHLYGCKFASPCIPGLAHDHQSSLEMFFVVRWVFRGIIGRSWIYIFEYWTWVCVPPWVLGLAYDKSRSCHFFPVYWNSCPIHTPPISAVSIFPIAQMWWNQVCKISVSFPSRLYFVNYGSSYGYCICKKYSQLSHS